MGSPVVHFEVIGRDPSMLRAFYRDVFGWEFDTGAAVAQEISEQGNYGFIARNTTSDGTGIPGGVGGGSQYKGHSIFYVGVPDVEAALRKAESCGGKRVLGPVANTRGHVVVGHFTDPEGILVGVAGPK